MSGSTTPLGGRRTGVRSLTFGAHTTETLTAQRPALRPLSEDTPSRHADEVLQEGPRRLDTFLNAHEIALHRPISPSATATATLESPRKYGAPPSRHTPPCPVACSLFSSSIVPGSIAAILFDPRWGHVRADRAILRNLETALGRGRGARALSEVDDPRPRGPADPRCVHLFQRVCVRDPQVRGSSPWGPTLKLRPYAAWPSAPGLAAACCMTLRAVRFHWVSGLGVLTSRWPPRDPAPHCAPAI